MLWSVMDASAIAWSYFAVSALKDSALFAWTLFALLLNYKDIFRGLVSAVDYLRNGKKNNLCQVKTPDTA